MLTIIVIVDPHISCCGVHDLIRVCGEGFLVARWQQVALFLQLSNQLRTKVNQMKTNGGVFIDKKRL